MKGDVNPINLFAEEVKNILGREATSLYRLDGMERVNLSADKIKFIKVFKISPGAHGFFIFKEGKEEIDLPCNFGTEGDILWVRENWEDYTDPELNKGFKDEARELFLSSPDKKSWPSFEFMPKAACRIFLKITSIRPDRLQNIVDEESAYKMGNYSYKDLWKRNKWVFVIDFERIDPKQYAAENKKFAKWMGNKPL